VEQINHAIKESEKNIIMTNEAQLDAVIAALPQQIETAVNTSLAPAIAAIQAAAAANGIDLTNEVNSLQAIPAAVASAVAAAVTPPAPPPAAT